MLALAAVINTIYQKNPEGIVWLCYIGLFIISVGMLFKNDTLIVSQLNILAIPLSIWIIDFFSYFYLGNTGQTILGITEYMFTEGNLFSKIISLQHFFTIPFSLGVLSIIKIKQKHAWIFSTIQLAIIFTISRLFTSPEKNINYVFRFAEYDLISPSLYPLAWFAVFFLMVVITEVILIKLVSEKD
ncbi:MAG: hypothetical protein RL557_203 [archaeon]